MAGANPTSIGSVVPIWTNTAAPASPVTSVFGPRTYASVPLAGAGGFVDVPGPAAGFVRFFDSITPISNTVAGTLTLLTGRLDPGALPFGSAAAATQAVNIAVGVVLGAGQSYRVTNGGANAGRVCYSYFDVPAGTITIVRLALAAAPAVAIPAPATGANRIIRTGQASNGSTTIRSNAIIFNADTATVNTEWFLNGTLFTRAPSNTTLALGTPASGIPDAIAGAGDVSVGLAAAPATTSPTLLLAYESLAA